MPQASTNLCSGGARYEPRSAATAIARIVVAEELDGFVRDAEERGHPLPAFVVQTLRDFVSCGSFEHGFVRVVCSACGHERTVPFACKKRGVCSSCAGRRMAETAANLVDRVLPEVPVRQWVLSMPFDLRYRLAWDRHLLAPLVAAFVRAVFAWQRQRAKERLGISRAHGGAVTFVQRFGGALNLNVHFHTLVLDGVYEVLPRSSELVFHALPAPAPDGLASVLSDVVDRFARSLGARGYLVRGSETLEDDLARTDPGLAAIYGAAVQGRTVTGAAPGGRVVRLARSVQASGQGPIAAASAAVLGGFSLHAGVSVHAHDRAGLERLCRYIARPAVASSRLHRLEDGRVVLKLRHRWNDGTSAIVFEPKEFVARLAAQVPPPRVHQVRYHGVLAPCAHWRQYVVPSTKNDSTKDSRNPHLQAMRPPRIAWSELLRRVFAIDVLHCERCGGRMRVLPARSAAPTTCRGDGRSPPDGESLS